MTYDSDQEKGDAPSVEDMVPVGTYEIGANEGNSPDNINGRLPLNERHRNAVNAQPDEEVWLRVRSNGNQVVTKQRIYESGRGITLEHPERQELDLEPYDEVKYWIAKVERDSDENTQASLEESAGNAETPPPDQEGADEDEKYVWLADTNSTNYHLIDPEDESQTACGMKITDYDARKTSDPGGFLDQCGNCARRESDELTNKELIESIGELAGFSADSNRSNYLTREQLVAIRERLLEFDEKVGSAE